MSDELTNELKSKCATNVIFKRQIVIKSIQFIGLLYIVYGIFLSFANVCIILDVKANNESKYPKFWDPIAAIYSTANCLVFTMIIYYKVHNYKIGHAKLISMPDDQMIVCFILAPLFFFAVVNLVVEVSREIIIIPCQGYLNFLIPLSTLLLFVGAAILIFDVGQNVPMTRNWKMNLLRANVAFFTVIGIANYFIISFSIQHIMIFQQESKNSSYGMKFIPNNSCIMDMPIRKLVDDAYTTCDKYLRSTVLLFCVCTFAYLIQPMLQKQKSAKALEYESFYVDSINSDLNVSISQESDSGETTSPLLVDHEHLKDVNTPQTPSFRLPSAALVLCIIFLSLSFLSFIIMLSLYNSTNLKSTGKMVFAIFPIAIYILGIGLSIEHIKEVGNWPILLNRRGKVIDKCLIWIGAAGQLSISMASIAFSIESLVDTKSNANTTATVQATNLLLIPNNLLIIAQTFLQTLLISLAIDRRWMRPEINSWAEVLCPAVGMMGLNIGLLLLSISDMNFEVYDDSSNFLFMVLFIKGLKSIGGTLTTLQRLHASILFASMIVYTHN